MHINEWRLCEFYNERGFGRGDEYSLGRWTRSSTTRSDATENKSQIASASDCEDVRKLRSETNVMMKHREGTAKKTPVNYESIAIYRDDEAVKESQSVSVRVGALK